MIAASEPDTQREKSGSSKEAQLSLPFIPTWLDDYGLTPQEFRVYCRVARRAGKDGRCWESVTNIAEACRLCRNATLKALSTLTEVHKLLIKNKREGETDEYSLAPASDWAPPVPPEDRFLSRRKREVAEANPSLQGTGSSTLEGQEPVLEGDTKVIQIMEYQEKQQQNVVVSLDFEKPSIWRRSPDATRYCQIPPIYNEATGVEVQRQMDDEGITAQKVVERAIAFSKVPRLLLETLASINEKLIDAYKWLSKGLPKSDNKTQTEPSGIPEEQFNRLKEADIHLNRAVADQLWQKYSSEFPKAIAYVVSKDKVKDKAAYFRKCLEQGWLKDTVSQPQSRDPYELNEEQKQWYDWATSSELCDGRPIRHCALMSGEVAILIYEPELQCHTNMPLSRAMEKYPIT